MLFIPVSFHLLLLSSLYHDYKYLLSLSTNHCREGINFALTRPEDHTPGAPPPYINFLSVLGEFSNRLLEVDRTGKKGVLVFLQVSQEQASGQCSILYRHVRSAFPCMMYGKAPVNLPSVIFGGLKFCCKVRK